MKKTWFILLPLIIVMLGACANAPEPKPQKTQLEIRQMQTRTYDTQDLKMVMKAVMHALQDDNFIIQQADIDLGLLTAQKEVDLVEENSGSFSWGGALAVGAVVVAIGAAIAILSSGNQGNSSVGSSLDRDGSRIGYEPRIGGGQKPSFDNSAITEAVANISEFGEQTHVRLNFQVKVLDNHGTTAEVEQIQEPKFYQDFFAKVDKAIFLGKENLQ